MIQNGERWFLHSIIAYQLDHSPPHVPSMYITPHNHTADNNFYFWYLNTHHIFPFNRNFNYNFMIFNCEAVPSDYTYICILAFTTLKMATWVAETYRWSLLTKITVIHQSSLVGLFNKCYAHVGQRLLTDVPLVSGHLSAVSSHRSKMYKKILMCDTFIN